MANSILTFSLGGFGNNTISFIPQGVPIGGVYPNQLQANDMIVNIGDDSVRTFATSVGNCTTDQQKTQWLNFINEHNLLYFVRTSGHGGNKRLIIQSNRGYMIYEVTLTHSHAQPPAQPAAQPAAQQGGKKRNKGYRRMSRRSRRSKLRSRRTIRRGGKNCNGINKSNNFSLRMKEHIAIIAKMSRIYQSDPHHVFTLEVKELKEKYCEEFLKELILVIDGVYGKYKETRLKSFYQALLRRENALIKQNLNNT